MSITNGDVVVRSRVFRAPKAGHRESEYEDAHARSESDALPLHVAVADGATESAFARTWAECLVKAWIAEPARTEAGLREHLPAWQAAWRTAVESGARDLPWYAAAKMEQGAFAAFLGLSLDADGTWQALAVGDCCLFVLSEAADPVSWPLTHPEQFTSTPALIPSRPCSPIGQVHTRSGTWRPTDTFVLATDAAAAWLLRTGPPQATTLTKQNFPARLDAARAAGTIRNDDTTLVVLELQPPS